MSMPQPRHSPLSVLLMHAIKVRYSEYHKDTEEVLTLIGKGMHWSEELNAKARALADKIVKEFEDSNPYP